MPADLPAQAYRLLIWRPYAHPKRATPAQAAKSRATSALACHSRRRSSSQWRHAGEGPVENSFLSHRAVFDATTGRRGRAGPGDGRRRRRGADPHRPEARARRGPTRLKLHRFGSPSSRAPRRRNAAPPRRCLHPPAPNQASVLASTTSTCGMAPRTSSCSSTSIGRGGTQR